MKYISQFLRPSRVLGSLLVLLFVCPSVLAQEESDTSGESTKDRYEKFEQMLHNVKLVGSFTLLGDEDKELREEVYVIEKVTKMRGEHQWSFKARIKFGEYDYSAAIPLDVQWAGDTPMITMTDVAIPTLGTFSARVLFYNGKYAGTWTHGDKGGHLFGKILPNDSDEGESDDDDADDGDSDG